MSEPVILFDGVCNLCAGCVQFVIRRDRQARFRFASLQSDVGRALLAQHGVSDPDLTSMVLIDNGRVYRKSRAALHTCRMLDGAWKLLAIGLIIPAFIADRVYDFIGARRYRWFGRTETCWLPAPGLRERFLDQS